MQKTEARSYNVVGLMSGTSLDGLDIAAITFITKNKKWHYQIHHATTIPYPAKWQRSLEHADTLTGRDLLQLHHNYGVWIGNEINKFLKNTGFIPLLICSHGHTVFHQPEKHFTFQLGNGYSISATTGINTVWDFRSLDVALGGQGAPLVPAGDELLFPDYDYCINLGGFANISFKKNGERIAYDPCPANLAMLHVVRPLGVDFDKNGEIGSKGEINPGLIEELNNLSYYHLSPPKSLGKEWLQNVFLPVLDRYNISTEDKLRTIYEHIAIKLSETMASSGKKNALITGGGAKNMFLINRINALSTVDVKIPDQVLVDYKEALIFALLGILKLKGEINCYASVTGASRDSSTGSTVLLNI